MIAQIIERLKPLPGLKLVGSAADFAVASETSPRAWPAAYVLPLSERVLHDDGLGDDVTQVVEATYGIALALSNVSDAKGGAAAIDLDTLRAAVREALLGWCPAGCEDTFSYAAGALLGFANQVIWWQDAYVIHRIVATTD